jgi:transposase
VSRLVPSAIHSRQIHGVDAAGAVVIRKRISRAKLLEFFAALPDCLVGIDPEPT